MIKDYLSDSIKYSTTNGIPVHYLPVEMNTMSDMPLFGIIFKTCIDGVKDCFSQTIPKILDSTTI